MNDRGDAQRALDKFGQFIVATLRDRAIEQHMVTQAGNWKAPRLQVLQQRLAELSPTQRRLVLDVVVDVVDTALHDLLFALQEAHDFNKGIAVLVDGSDVAAGSDGLQGEPYGPGGWVSRFSRFPHLPPE
jgi:hypothetical protein